MHSTAEPTAQGDDYLKAIHPIVSGGSDVRVDLVTVTDHVSSIGWNPGELDRPLGPDMGG